jgi:hypothetical protein
MELQLQLEREEQQRWQDGLLRKQQLLLKQKDDQIGGRETRLTKRVLTVLGVDLKNIAAEVAHFKGFARTEAKMLEEDKVQLQAIAKQLSNFKVVCYDGDVFKHGGDGSFVKVLVYLMKSYPRVHVIAFKKVDQPESFHEHFMNLWDTPTQFFELENLNEPVSQKQALINVSLEDEQAWSEQTDLDLTKRLEELAEKSSIIVLWVTAQPDIEGMEGWKAFGPQVIQYTGANNVYAIGGGKTSFEEYEWMSNDEHLSFRTKWHYFPAVRVSTPENPESTLETSFFETLEHPVFPGNFIKYDVGNGQTKGTVL